MTPVWLMSALDIHSEMLHAAKPKTKDLQVQVLSVEADEEQTPLWVHNLLEHSWLDED